MHSYIAFPSFASLFSLLKRSVGGEKEVGDRRGEWSAQALTLIKMPAAQISGSARPCV